MQAESQPLRLTNRFTATTTDGWVQLAPYGEFPHGSGEGRVVQVVDRRAAEDMVENFEAVREGGGRLPYLDFDHLGDDHN